MKFLRHFATLIYYRLLSLTRMRDRGTTRRRGLTNLPACQIPKPGIGSPAFALNGWIGRYFFVGSPEPGERVFFCGTGTVFVF